MEAGFMPASVHK